MPRVNDLERWLKTGSAEPAPIQPTEPASPAEPAEPAQPLEVPVAADPPAQPDLPAAAAPAEPPVPNAAFREIAKLRKEIRQLQQGRAPAATAAAAAAPTEPEGIDYDGDPAGALKQLGSRVNNLENLNRNLAAQNQALIANQNTLAQETNYRAGHPHYDAALKALQDSEEKIWTDTGGLTALAAQLLDQNEEFLEREAASRGVPAEDVALEIARNQIVAGGRGQLMEIARRTGQPFPEVIVKAAAARGWKPSGAEAAATAQTPRSAQARVAAAIDRNRGTSLSTMETGTRGQAPSIQDKEALDEFLQTAGPEERARYISQRDQEDPQWFERMFSR